MLLVVTVEVLSVGTPLEFVVLKILRLALCGRVDVIVVGCPLELVDVIVVTGEALADSVTGTVVEPTMVFPCESVVV